MQGLLDGGPVISQIDVGFGHESCFAPVPLVKRVGSPAPLMEVSQGCCKGPFDIVPLMGFAPELVSDGDPCLFHMLDMIIRPVGDEAVQCPDVVDDHLVPGISKFLADLIVDDVLQSPLMQSKVFSQTLAQSQTVPGRQPLALETPECHRLDSPPVQPQPCAKVGQLEAPEFNPPLFVLVEPVLQGGDAASAAGCVVNAQISHHGLDWWVLRSQEFAQLTVDPFVCDDESGFVAVDNQPSFGQVVPEVMPCLKCSLGQMLGIGVTAIESDVIYPAIQV